MDNERTMREKFEYINGLVAGLSDNEQNSVTGKLLAAIVDLLDDLTDTVDMHHDFIAGLAESIGDDDDETFEFTCPQCDEKVYFDFDDFDGNITCPACGDAIEISMPDGCNCNCDECDSCE